MKKKKIYFQRMYCLFLTLSLLVCLINCKEINAKEVELGTPKITVKTFADGTGVKVVIAKTKNADRYTIKICGPSEIDQFRNVWVTPSYYDGFTFKPYDGGESEYQLYKNGKEKRSLTFTFLPPGNYTISVKAKNDDTGKEKWSKEKKVTLSNTKTKGYASEYDFTDVKPGSIIKFGEYEQDVNYTNGKEPIEWIVLEKNEDSLFVLSKYILDYLPYHVVPKQVATTWEYSSLRLWLNSVFLNSAFNDIEKDMIQETLLHNEDNLLLKKSGGNDTVDRVFLLSQRDVINSDYGFVHDFITYDINRRSAFSYYKGKEAYDIYMKIGRGQGYSITKEGEYSSDWWLRTPGEHGQACFVAYVGAISFIGKNVYEWLSGKRLEGKAADAGVRPAMYIKIKSEGA